MQHLVIPMFYLLLRGPFAPWIDSLGTYAMTAVELMFVVATCAIYKPWTRLWRKLSGLEFFELVAAVGLGAIAAFVAQSNQWAIPFDASLAETILWLTLLGPLLEEAVFRLALWLPIERAWSSQGAWVLTSVLFSLGHLQAYFYVPSLLKPFVLYQTAYTLVLGLWWGQRFKQSSLLAAMLTHVAFNVGFWLMIR